MPPTSLSAGMERSMLQAASSGELQSAEHLATALTRLHREGIESHRSRNVDAYLLEPCLIRDATYCPRPYLATAIVSTYKAARFLRGRLEDLLAQTIGNRLEILVIDSFSPEDESGIVAEYQQLSDNIRYLRTSRRETVYQAWNRGVQHARGHYLTNANTDDRLKHDAMERLTQALDLHPEAGFAFANFHITNHPNETFDAHHAHSVTNRPPYTLNALLENSITGSQPVWRRTLHDQHGCFDIGYSSAADYDFFIRVGRSTGALRIAEPLGLVWTSPETFSGKGKLPALEFYAIRERYRHLLTPTGVPERVSPDESELLSRIRDSGGDIAGHGSECCNNMSPECSYEIGLMAEERGNWGEAWRFLQRAWYLKPESACYRAAVERLLTINLLQSVRETAPLCCDGASPDNLLTTALACSMLGCRHLAVMLYYRTLSLYPDHAPALAQLQKIVTP